MMQTKSARTFGTSSNNPEKVNVNHVRNTLQDIISFWLEPNDELARAKRPIGSSQIMPEDIVFSVTQRSAITVGIKIKRENGHG